MEEQIRYLDYKGLEFYNKTIQEWTLEQIKEHPSLEFKTVASLALAEKKEGVLYFAEDQNLLYAWSAEGWLIIGGDVNEIIDLRARKGARLATLDEDGYIFETDNRPYTKEEIEEFLNKLEF